MQRIQFSAAPSTRNLPLLLAVFAMLFFMATCAPDEPIKLGFVGGLSGRVADLGISGRDGTTLAIEQRNAKGGIGGRKIKLIATDDKQDPATAAMAVENLVNQGVAAIIGHMTSSMSMRTVPIINKHKLVMVSPTTTTTYLSGKDDYFIRVSSTVGHYAERMAYYQSDIVGHKRVAIIYDINNKAYTESWVGIFKQHFTARDGQIVHIEPYQSGEAVSFFTVIEKVPMEKIDALIIVAGALDTAMLCQQVRKKGLDLPIVASEWSATEKLVDMGGQSVEGIVVNQFFDRHSKDPKYLEFRDAYLKRFNEEPGFASVNAYDATNLVLDALDRHSDDQALKDTILDMPNYNGVQGTVRIDRFGDADRKTFLTTIRQGQFISLE